MQRKEWFVKVDYALNDPNSRLFDSGEALEAYRKDFPEILYFIEVSSVYEAIDASKTGHLIEQAGERAIKMADGISALLL